MKPTADAPDPDAPGDGQLHAAYRAYCRSCTRSVVLDTGQYFEAEKWLRLNGWSRNSFKGWRCPECVKEGRDL